jgi:small-conductance mechanosensitive channel
VSGRVRDAGLCAVVVFAALLLGAPAAAQTPTQGPTAQPTTPEAGEPAAPEDPAEEIREKLRQLGAERTEVVRQSAAGDTPQGASQELELIAGIERVYEDQLAALGRREELQEAKRALEQRLAAGPAGSLAVEPPFPLILLDAVGDAHDAQAKHTRAVRAALEASRSGLDKATEALERAEQERRLAREEADAAEDPVRAARLRAAQRLAAMRSREAEARRELAVLERDNLKAEAALQEQTEELLAETVAWVRERVGVGPDALREPLRRIEEAEFEATRLLERTERELQAAEARVELVERRLAATARPPPELVAELEARRLEQQLLVQRAASLADRAKQLESNRTLWERRRAVLAETASREDQIEWGRDIGEELQETARSARLTQARLSELRQEAEAARERARQAETDGNPAAPWEAQRARLLEQMAQLHEEELATAADDRALAQRVLEDMRSRTTRVTLAERVEAAVDRIEEVWDTEILAVEDQPITVGKVTGALLVFLVGILLSSLSTRLVGRILRRRLDEGAASAIQGLLFYVLVAVTFLLALRTVNIPLTAFAILGGALAIGVGFGSQNIVNNFISGLILLAERPIKVGDLVEVGEVIGHVERIGARSTRVRTFSNTHLIIPNSHFLEKEVVNWTLSDDDIRTSVDVGVVYGSPTRDVDRLLRRAMTEHDRIMKSPEPQVWFTGFGDNSLDFRALFWVRSRHMGERLRIESEIRFRIDDLFREAGIVIAFPQRDVHLDATRPIEVRVLPPDEEPTRPKVSR